MLTSELDYELPEALIAQQPAQPRDSSRLMVVDVREGSIAHHVFRDLPAFLRPRDALVLNETKVLPARLVAHKGSGGEVELLFLTDLGGPWEVLARPSRGRMPLPPYIRPTASAERAYQTVYARNPGSAAAPTAGFHFTEEVLDRAGRAGARIVRVTLHVGTGTFAPIRAQKLEEHEMHAEHYSIPESAARTVENAGRVVAAGTTVARTLETWALTGEREGESRLFIYPGYGWRTVDVLLTN